MPKNEVDRSQVEQDPFALPPEELFGDQIKAETRKFNSDIAKVGKKIVETKVRLASFSDKSNAVDSYIRHCAMLALFDEHSLLEAYYDPENSKRAHYVATETGWEMWLAPENLRGAFRVFFSDVTTNADSSERRGQYLLQYIIPRHGQLPRYSL